MPPLSPKGETHRRPSPAVHPRLLYLAALALGLLSMNLTRQALKEGEKARASVPVVVASTPLAAGKTLTSEDVRIALYPPGLVPEGAIPSLEQVVGRRLASAAGRGEPITASRLVSRRPPEGFRDVAVSADGAEALQPGELADIMVVDGDPATPPKILAEGRLVVSVEDREGERIVVLRLRAEEARAVAEAMARGRLVVVASGAPN